MAYMKLTPSVAGEWRSLRDQTAYPAVPHIFGSTSEASRILANNHAKASPDAYYIYQEDVILNGVLRAKKGDRWWKVYEANGQPVTTAKWAAEIHLGARYLNASPVDDAPPPPPPGKTVTGIVIDDPTKVTINYSDGTSQTFP